MVTPINIVEEKILKTVSKLIRKVETSDRNGFLKVCEEYANKNTYSKKEAISALFENMKLSNFKFDDVSSQSDFVKNLIACKQYVLKEIEGVSNKAQPAELKSNFTVASFEYAGHNKIKYNDSTRLSLLYSE